MRSLIAPVGLVGLLAGTRWRRPALGTALFGLILARFGSRPCGLWR